MVEIVLSEFTSGAFSTNGFHLIGSSGRSDLGRFGYWSEDKEEIFIRNKFSHRFCEYLIFIPPFDLLDERFKVNDLYVLEVTRGEHHGIKIIAEFVTETDALLFKLSKP